MPESDPPRPSIGELLYEVGWCQGAILPEAVVAGIRPASCPEHYRQGVLITQDCNLVADDVKEPKVEIALGFTPEAGESVNEYAYGKNPRLFLTEGETGQRIVWDVRERLSIEKAALATVLSGTAPIDKMLSTDLWEFRAWLGRRYTRPAFPNTFNKRLRPVRSDIDKVIKSEAFRSIRGVYYLITERDEELPDGIPYHLQIIFCYRHNGTESPIPAAETELAKFAAAIRSCPGIDLSQPKAISDSRFTIEYLDRWELVDFDFRSYGHLESAPPRA